MNPLIPHCFDGRPHNAVNSLRAAAKNKDFAGELFDPQ
jgi:hypothetical protein